MSIPENQLRYNPLTQQWVIYAPARGQRPGHDQQQADAPKNLPERDEQCPFCPGNEHMLPAIMDQIPSDEPWLTRTVPNKFPALTPDTPAGVFEAGPYAAAGACGIHEVVIETPDHHCDLTDLPATHIEHVLETYRRRMQAIRKAHQAVETVVIFRNHGTSSGTSLIHPHAQLIASAIIPKYIRDRQAAAEAWYRRHQRCLLCEMIAWETRQNCRCVIQTDAFMVVVPFCAEVPYEQWVVPKHHEADFARLDETQKADLAGVLKRSLSGLSEQLNDPDYNYIIHSASSAECRSPALHWYLQIRPRISTPAGFEIGSGVMINPSWPEDNASLLRKAVNHLKT